MKLAQKHLLVECLGWYGAVAILAAYFCNTFGMIRSDALAYQLLNLTGAIGVGINAFWHRTIPSLAIQGVWAAIAAVGIIAFAHR